MLYLLLLPALAAADTVRIMSFNIWQSGINVNDGMTKIVKHIKIVNPDVVAVQEVNTCNNLTNITKQLGNEWNSVCYCSERHYADLGIITRHEIDLGSYVNSTKQAVGVKIRLKTGRAFYMWSAHFDTIKYGPDEINDHPNLTKEALMTQEYNTKRIKEIQNVENNQAMQEAINNSDTVPIFFAGDFNSPSHLDWIESTKHLHNNWTFDWPPTKIFADIGFKDSFREIHPDPLIVPGNTWSPVRCSGKGNTQPVLQDRIDFILYQGNAKPIYSYMYGTHIPLRREGDKEIRKNDYPSDHYAVVTAFELN